MSITLTPDLEAYVEKQAHSGAYASPDAVVQEAVRRMMAEEQRHEAAVMEGLRDQIAPLTAAELQQVRGLAQRGRGAA